MRAYCYMVKVRLLITLAYRFDVFTSTLANIIQVICSVVLWKAVYSGSGSVEGISESQMITYTILSFLLMPVFHCGIQDTVNQRVRKGDIATDVIRPISIMGTFFAQDIGGSAGVLITRLIPSFLVVSLFIQAPLPYNALSALLFIPSCLLSYGILWLMSALISLTAFYASEIGNMGMVKDIVIRLLAGSYVPLWFFPKAIQNISMFLPFQYTYQTPLGIYIGRTDTSQALFAMAVQGVWILALLLLLRLGWAKAKRKLLVQGG